MSSWRRQFGSIWGNNPSPYASRGNMPVPRVRDGDFSYMTPDGASYSQRPRQQNSSYFPPQARPIDDDDEDEDAEPDVLILRHRGSTYALQFRAYSIGDGIVTVGDVRRAAGNALDVARLRRIKLLYKGRLLKDDDLPAKSAGIKQHSEVMCVVSHGYEPGDTSSESSESEEVAHRQGAKRNENNDDSNKPSRTHGSRRRRPARSRGPPDDRTRQPSAHSAAPTDRRPVSSSIPPTTNKKASYLTPPTDNRPSSSGTSRSPTPSRLPTPSPNLNTVKSPREKLALLEEYFDTVIRPLCRKFIDDPPADPKARDLEHKRISETTMAQVILKTDSIEIDGDNTLRQRRKAFIVNIQNQLKRVDEVIKPSG